jgi:hypothetical protein
MSTSPISSKQQDKEAAMATTALNDWRELAQRTGDGLEVTLLWSKSLARVRVAVADSRTGERFELEVAGRDALDAFRHPFAYASRGGRPQSPRRRRDPSLADRREHQ